MFHSITGSGRWSRQSGRLQGAAAAAVVFIFLPAVPLMTGGCAREPAYANYQAKHTTPEEYNAAGSGPTRPLALTGQVVAGADPLWKQYAVRTQAFVPYGTGTAAAAAVAEARTGGAEKSAPARASRKTAGKKTGKKVAKKAAKSTTPKTPAAYGGLFPEPVCPEGCVPAPGYRRATPAPAQASAPAAQVPPSVSTPGSAPAASVPSVTPSTAFAPPPASAGPASAPGNGKAQTTTPSAAAAPATSPAGASPQAPPPALPALSTPPGTDAPGGSRLLPPVGSRPAPEKDSALAPPGSSDLGYAPAPPPQ
ncbi:MAG: hypothetical protein LBP38_00485 [Desulfovibrio sp.]|nr:hypothetical protein [Desulfovibrio sp.]